MSGKISPLSGILLQYFLFSNLSLAIASLMMKDCLNLKLSLSFQKRQTFSMSQNLTKKLFETYMETYFTRVTKTEKNFHMTSSVFRLLFQESRV